MTTSDQLKTTLASSVSLYIKGEGFHFNVEGDNFVQLHALFGEVYAFAYDSIDRLGEYVRVVNGYAPGSLSRMLALSEIDDQDKIPKDTLMVQELYDDCEVMLRVVSDLYKVADDEGHYAIANYAADLQDGYGKLCWKLRSFLKVRRGYVVEKT